MKVFIALFSAVVYAKSPDGPSQQCADDAGPPWADDVDNPYSGSPALPVLNQNGQCANPLQGACQTKSPLRAYLEGPVNCGGRGWFCRIAPQSGWQNPFYQDKNFAHCNATDADERDDDGHCHGSDVDSVYGWWVRDHWFRGYAGTLHCCCDWQGVKGLVNRCDYRKFVSPEELDDCRDANEEHNKGYEGTCEAYKSIPFEEPVGTKEECWTVYNFASPEAVPNPSPILQEASQNPLPTPATETPSTASTSSPSASGGFDFGQGCQEGNGEFSLNLSENGQKINVGVIPKGKFNVRINLKAESDLDIALYDMEQTSEYEDGQAIVQWCNGKCNHGILGMNAKYEEAIYVRQGISPMLIKYSGFKGVGGRPGHEFIEIKGEVSTPLMMKAFAFQTGSAEVTYSWSRSESPCCQGIEKCSGSFSQYINQNKIVTVGEIPPGKRDVFISLSAETDVDIQIYDLDDTTQYPEGKAIVAWCAPAPCNSGALNGPTEKSVLYPNIQNPEVDRYYTYSGFFGVEGRKGHEFIRISGDTTRRLVMKAFGYGEGTATVRYEYFEQVEA